MKNFFSKWFQIFMTDPVTEKNFESNIRGKGIMYGILSVSTLLLTLQNIGRGNSIMAWSTLIACICFALSTFVIFKWKKTFLPSVLMTLIMIILFCYYILSGNNDGFAALWVLLVPLLAMGFCGMKIGGFIGLFFAIFIPVVFYLPACRVFIQDSYSQIMLNRFPIMYLAAFNSSFVLMMQKQNQQIKQNEYEKQLESYALEQKELKNKAEVASKAKSDFLANMSHEIRTPLNAILGMDEMILRESQEKETLGYATDIQVAGNVLLSLINDTLDFSKIEDGKMEILIDTYETGAMFEGLYNMNIQRAEKNNLDLQFHIDTSLPKEVKGDQVRITQVLTNILTNAIKYTEKGSVILTAKLVSREGNKARILYSVKDTGIGIREDDKRNLFEAFRRADLKHNINIEGTGLGLAITTQLLELMDSHLQLESTYGKGSLFYFEMEQEIASQEEVGDFQKNYIQKSHSATASRSSFVAPEARVLVVDDNALNRKLFVSLLKQTQVKVEALESGQQCLQALPDQHYDIIFLDHLMPGMDGIETLEEIRKLPYNESKDAPVIALTANAIAGAREMYLGAGFDDYLSKPIKIQELDAMLRQYLPKELVKDQE